MPEHPLLPNELAKPCCQNSPARPSALSPAALDCLAKPRFPDPQKPFLKPFTLHSSHRTETSVKTTHPKVGQHFQSGGRHEKQRNLRSGQTPLEPSHSRIKPDLAPQIPAAPPTNPGRATPHALHQTPTQTIHSKINAHLRAGWARQQPIKSNKIGIRVFNKPALTLHKAFMEITERHHRTPNDVQPRLREWRKTSKKAPITPNGECIKEEINPKRSSQTKNKTLAYKLNQLKAQ